MTEYLLKSIPFTTILPVWRDNLWPNRISKIETHSVMTWPATHTDQSYDMSIFLYPAYFFGIYFQQQLIAVNSGHLTSKTEFRSRGLWVDPNHRKHGLASILLHATIQQARNSNANMIWSIPRLTSLSVYEKCGFMTVGDSVEHGMEFGPNIYCLNSIC